MEEDSNNSSVDNVDREVAPDLATEQLASDQGAQDNGTEQSGLRGIKEGCEEVKVAATVTDSKVGESHEKTAESLAPLTDSKVEESDEKVAENVAPLTDSKVEESDEKVAENVAPLPDSKVEESDEKVAENVGPLTDSKVEVSVEKVAENVAPLPDSKVEESDKKVAESVAPFGEQDSTDKVSSVANLVEEDGGNNSPLNPQKEACSKSTPNLQPGEDQGKTDVATVQEAGDSYSCLDSTSVPFEVSSGGESGSGKVAEPTDVEPKDNLVVASDSIEKDEDSSLAAAPATDEGYTDIQSPEAGSLPAGSSNDREEISDGELDLASDCFELPLEGATSIVAVEHVKPVKEDVDQKSCEPGETGPADADKEAVDVKSDDAGSIADDASRQSKGPSEDLEAVSDDDLPEATHKESQPANKALIEGGEDVSSEDEEQMHTGDVAPKMAAGSGGDLSTTSTNLAAPGIAQDTPAPQSDREPVSPTALAEPVSPTALPEAVSPTALPEPVSPTALPELAPLDAEPISDEEDNSALGEDEDAEAGEIKSPTEDITSPPSSPEQGAANLGEVEPVSADESNDTDGEIASGDDDDPTKPGAGKDAKFESIESDEEGDLGGAPSSSQQLARTSQSGTSQGSEVNKKAETAGYMESISDEESQEAEGSKKKESAAKDPSQTATSGSSSETQGASSQPAKDSSLGKVVAASNFNEHQVELDYEENDGDETEAKPEESVTQPQIKDGEDGEIAGDGGSDKDEGELSDDDCEEGEIKEPGSRKPFVKPMCRFFQRGHCTWGINCRFLHPGVNDKGNYQMIEIPGFQPTGIHARIGPWVEQPPVEQIEIPPPPLPNTPPPETAWERGLRIAKEQRKKATERKEKEPDFEEKRLNLSVDEERELNKENERAPRIIPKDPYYDQQAYEEDEYYKISRDPWQTGHYENFEVRYNREPSFSPPPYREKPPMPMPPPRYSRPYSPPPPQPHVDRFGRDRTERREEYRPKPAPPPPAANDYPSPPRRPDEWVDPWRRQTAARKNSKSPQRTKYNKPGRPRERRGRRSVSDSSNSSRSGSGSSSGSSRSSRSYSGSSGSSSRSRSPEPAPPGVDRHDNRYNNQSPTSRDQPRSAVSVRGRGGGRGGYHNNSSGYDPGFRRDQQGYGRPRDGGGGGRGEGGFRSRGGGPGGPYHPHGGARGGPGGYHGNRDMGRDRGRDDRMGRPRLNSPPGRPLPYTRPRPRSASSRSSSSRSGSGSRSRSRSRGRAAGKGAGRDRYSSSRSSSGSSSSRSSYSSSPGSADSEHLYRDLGSPGKSPTHRPGPPQAAKKKRPAPPVGHKDRAGPPSKSTGPLGSNMPPLPGSQRHAGASSSQQPRHHMNLDNIPVPRDPREARKDSRDSRDTREARDLRGDPRDARPSREAGGDPRDSRPSRDAGMAGTSGGRPESRYASRNAPQAPVKAKDPLKVMGQKSNIKLTLLPKQQQSSLGNRPNPLDSPPHNKRRISDRDSPPLSAPPAKRLNLPIPQSTALRIATEKAAKIHQRQEKGRPSPPPPSSMPSSGSSSLHHHSSIPSGNPPSSSRARAPVSPQKQSSSSLKSRGMEPPVGKTAPKMPAGGGGALPGAATASSSAPVAGSSSGAKAKKSMSSRREELLKQLKAVEDAIARKKVKLT